MIFEFWMWMSTVNWNNIETANYQHALLKSIHVLNGTICMYILKMKTESMKPIFFIILEITKAMVPQPAPPPNWCHWWSPSPPPSIGVTAVYLIWQNLKKSIKFTTTITTITFTITFAVTFIHLSPQPSPSVITITFYIVLASDWCHSVEIHRFAPLHRECFKNPPSIHKNWCLECKPNGVMTKNYF